MNVGRRLCRTIKVATVTVVDVDVAQFLLFLTVLLLLNERRQTIMLND